MATLYKRGRVWWAGGVDRHGQRWQRSTKQTDERAARQVAARLEQDLAVEAHRSIHEACTLEVAIAALLNFSRSAGRAEGTVEFHETKARHLLRLLGARRLCASITPAMTSAYAQQRIAEGAHRHTVQKELRVLLQALRRAKKLRLFAPDVDISELKPDEVKSAYSPRDRWLTPTEYKTLLEELDPTRGGRTRRRRLTKESALPTSDDVVRLGKLSGREHWDEATARTVLMAWAKSGQPMRSFARAHGFAVQRILWWRDQLGMRDELDAISARVAEDLDERVLEEDRRDYVIALCLTGARLKELYGIHAKHVNLERTTLFLASGTKTKLARRTVPLAPAVAAVLERRIARFGRKPLFPAWDKVSRDLYAACLRIEARQNPSPRRRRGEGAPLNPKGNPLPKRDRVRPPNPFDPVSPIDLRRTYASWIAQAGVPVLHAVKLMGHGSMAMLQRVYAQLGTDHLQDAIDMLPAELTGGRRAAPVPLEPGEVTALEAEVARLRAELDDARAALGDTPSPSATRVGLTLVRR